MHFNTHQRASSGIITLYTPEVPSSLITRITLATTTIKLLIHMLDILADYSNERYKGPEGPEGPRVDGQWTPPKQTGHQAARSKARQEHEV